MSFNPEVIVNDKVFISNQMKYVPYRFKEFLSQEEIRAELNFTIVNCSKKFNPRRGTIFNYVQRSFINNLNTLARDRSFFYETEAPISAAFDMTYTENNPEEAELMAYLHSLPVDLLTDLTDFVLGKKNKEEIIANPSFQRINIDRVIENLDCLIC
jgi:hypothetical protein